MLLTTDRQEIDVDILTWGEVRELFTDPELIEIIDELSPSDEYKFFKARYPYGAKIIDKSDTYLPLKNGNTIAFNSEKLPKTITEHLSYDPQKSNPVSTILSKKSEVYLSIGNRIMPYYFAHEGIIIGLARVLDYTDMRPDVRHHHLSFLMWEYTSGTRSLFLLPKITNELGHSKLKRAYNITSQKPNNYHEHFFIFKEIAEHMKLEWRSEFLFFSNKWFKQLKDPAWIKLYNYCLKKNRHTYSFWRNILSWQVIFALIEEEKNLQFSSYTLNTAHHLFAIAAGAALGFAPVTGSNAGPIKVFQEAYVNTYGLHDSQPIMMQPTSLSMQSTDPVYYSLNYPTLAQYDPQTFKGRSLIILLDELAYAMKKYIDGIKQHQLAAGTFLSEIAQSVKFDFYHSSPQSYEAIQPSSAILEHDKRFYLSDYTGVFPKNSPFLNGCIKISLQRK